MGDWPGRRSPLQTFAIGPIDQRQSDGLKQAAPHKGFGFVRGLADSPPVAFGLKGQSGDKTLLIASARETGTTQRRVPHSGIRAPHLEMQLSQLAMGKIH